MAKSEYVPRLQIELEQEQMAALNRHLRSGERSTLYRAVTRDLIDLMDRVGPGLVLAAVINRELKIEEYSSIGNELYKIIKAIEDIKRETEETREAE